MEDSAITPKMLETAWNADSKMIRKFLRELLGKDIAPGKGHRWAIDANAVDALKIRFDAWIGQTQRIISIDDIPLDSE